MIFAHVAVPVPARVGSLFTYAVPPGLVVRQGDLVVVPFSSRILPGIVVRVDETPPHLPTRELLGLLEGAPAVAPERVEVACWISDHYRSSLFDALGLFLPPGWQRAVAERGDAAPEARAWVFRWPPPPVDEETTVSLGPESGGVEDPAGEGSAVRVRVTSLLQREGPMAAGSVAAGAKCSLATVRKMVAEGTLVVVSDFTRRLPLPWGEERRGGEVGRPIVLNEAQEAAHAPIAAALRERRHQVFLLHGVTGSGKTHIYLRLIESLVRDGRRAIVLVSEIAQTPEALHRYSEHFPGRVAVLHSELSGAERWGIWRGIQLGRFDVVIGPRSAIFAPVPHLGLIVLDEEHEPAYKQEDRAPRYHAREVAIELGRRVAAAVVLGSATPDVVSYHLAERGVYRLESLPERYVGPSAAGWSAGRFPRVEVVDLREELKAGNSGIFSRALREGLERVLALGQQAILFLNRRGASTCVMCRDCGHVIKCRRCEAPMVYHTEPGELVCHLCNRRGPSPPECPRCRGSRIGFFGVGTERVEEEVRKQFPSARVLRWDRDVTGQRGAHERIHRQFRDHQADVLVGTQMVAKALDFPLVTLVGVVLADVTLHLPDFRAAERTFQLLAQVAGRAGRGSLEGQVIIQTYSPGHYSIVAASRHDYRSFYQQELGFRRYHSYPPFRPMARLLYSVAGEARSRFDALRLRKQLQAVVDELGIADVDLLGPAPAFHSRVRGRYRWQIVVAGDGLARLLREVELPLGWSVDVDPVSLL